MSQKHRRKPTSVELRISNGKTTYQMGTEIGRGGFGLVFNALNMETGDFVAVKRVSLENIEQESMSQLQMEIELLKKLHHPNIVKYIDTIKTDDYLHIVLEYMENGSLSNVIKKFGNFSESLTAIYVTQVLTGLAYLHEQGVLHRDIKGANILTSKDGQVKLADFGVAMKTNDPTDEVDVVGTPYWMAPEIIEMSAPTAACDVWSVGCVVLELLTGKPPYYDLAPMTALFRIVQDDFPPLPDGISEALRDFLMNTFKKEPFMRKSAVDLLEHPWLKNPKTHVSKVFDQVHTFVQQSDGLVEHEKESTMVVNTIKYFSIQQMNRKGEKQRERRDPRSPVESPTVPNGDQTVRVKGRIRIPDPVDTREPLSEDEDMSWADFDEAEGGLVKLVLSPTNSDDHRPTYGRDAKASPGASTPRVFGVPTPMEQMQPPNPVIAELKERSMDDSGSCTDSSSKSTHSRKTSMIADEDIQAQMRAVYGDMSAPEQVPQSPKNKPPKSKGLWSSFKELVSCLQSVDDAPRTPARTSSGRLFNLDRNEIQLGLNEMADHTVQIPAQSNNRLAPPLVRESMSTLEQYADDREDEDFGDIDIPEEGLLAIRDSRDKGVSDTGAEADELFDDPFANEGFDETDFKQNQEREVLKSLSKLVKEKLSSLEDSMSEEQVSEICNQVLSCFSAQPGLGSQIIQDHGVIPILRIINIMKGDTAVPLFLKIINKIIERNPKGQEYLSMLGLIPPIMRFAKHEDKDAISQIQSEASKFIEIICVNGKALQMFIGCGGLEVLVYFVSLWSQSKVDPLARKLVKVGLKAILQIFKLSVMRRHDFCKLLADCGLLTSLTAIFDDLVDDLLCCKKPTSESTISKWEDLNKAVEIIENFSKSMIIIIDKVSESTLIQTIVQAFPKIFKTSARSDSQFAELLVQLLKCLKNMALDPQIMDSLEEAGVISAVMPLLERCGTPCDDAYEASIIYLFFCLCRLKKSRQEAAAQSGIVPHLVRVINEQKSTKQFALHVVCDLAHTSPATRKKLNQSKVMDLFVSLLRVRGQQIVANWQTRALECLAVWMNNESHDVELMLCNKQSIENVTWAFRTLQQDNFEKFSESLLDLLSSSDKVAKAIGQHEEFVRELIERLQYPKARICTNLLKILKILYDNHRYKAKFVQLYDLDTAISKLAEDDGKVVVQNIALQLLKDFSST
mmetsp:Transcript_36161/g.47691  ORF Transcript_36161/g.47691 Transcript_36161/m.47691 type:complete len:1189 (+) Transcript_36161:175-3741(+)